MIVVFQPFKNAVKTALALTVSEIIDPMVLNQSNVAEPNGRSIHGRRTMVGTI